MLLFHVTNSLGRILLYDSTLSFYFSDNKTIIYQAEPKKKFGHFRRVPSTVHFGDPWYLVFHFLNFKIPKSKVTTLQAGRSWVRFPMMWLEFFNDKILPAALRPWGYQKYLLGR